MYYWVKLKCDVLRPDLLAYIIKTKKMCTNEKAMQTFSQHLPVPVWQVVRSFEIVMISVLILKTHMHIHYLS